MDNEVKWQDQYNSLFLTFPVRVPPTILEQLLLACTDRLQWPKGAELPELSKLFELLESFICDNRNWMKKGCSDGQMGAIEEKLNGLMICLQYQKHYGHQFWRAQPRSMQVSVLHAYIFLKMFVVALIPPNFVSLLHANSEEKLMTEVFKLENLVNQLMQVMKPIHTFMHRKDFATEADLTESFFSELFQFFKGMPRIKKDSMAKVPKIIQFVNVCLQIQTCEEQIRSRASSKSSCRRDRGSSQGRRENNFINKNTLDENKKDVMEFFKFDERIRTHTSFRKKKKLTVTSMQTKEKSQSNEKSRSPSLDRSLTIFQSDRIKRGTFNESPNRVSSNPKIRGRILTSKTNISDRSRQRSRKKSLENELTQQQRDCKIKKNIIHTQTVKVTQFSKLMNMEKGVSRGWGIIREYVNKKITQRKLQKLFLL